MGDSADRHPETLLGPLLWLLTRLARGAFGQPHEVDLRRALAAHAAALAAHPGAPTQVRLAAGALAIEHRQSAPGAGALRGCRHGRQALGA